MLQSVNYTYISSNPNVLSPHCQHFVRIPPPLTKFVGTCYPAKTQMNIISSLFIFLSFFSLFLFLWVGARSNRLMSLNIFTHQIRLFKGPLLFFCVLFPHIVECWHFKFIIWNVRFLTNVNRFISFLEEITDTLWLVTDICALIIPKVYKMNTVIPVFIILAIYMCLSTAAPVEEDTAISKGNYIF